MNKQIIQCRQKRPRITKHYAKKSCANYILKIWTDNTMAERNGHNPQNTAQTIKSVAIRIPKGKLGVNVDIQED